MGKVRISVDIDEDLLERITAVGFDVSDFLERAARLRIETMQGGRIQPGGTRQKKEDP